MDSECWLSNEQNEWKSENKATLVALGIIRLQSLMCYYHDIPTHVIC